MLLVGAWWAPRNTLIFCDATTANGAVKRAKKNLIFAALTSLLIVAKGLSIQHIKTEWNPADNGTREGDEHGLPNSTTFTWQNPASNLNLTLVRALSGVID